MYKMDLPLNKLQSLICHKTETSHQAKISHIGRFHMCYRVLFTNPSARAGYDTRSIFKRSLTGLNSEFSFS